MHRNPSPKLWRFSLKWLFGALTLVCIFLAWVLHAVHAQSRRQTIATNLTSKNCRLNTEFIEPSNAYSAATWLSFFDESYGRHVIRLDANKTSTFTVDDLGGLRYFPELRELTIRDTKLPSPALSHLGNLLSLEHLSLNGSEIPPGDLRFLARLPRLKRLSLSGMEIPPGDLQFIAELPLLESLTLTGSQIHAGDLKHLAKCPNLRHLYLSSANFPVDDLALIVDSQTLEIFELGSIQLTNISLSHLGRLKRLTKLVIDGEGITDEGLAYLEQCASLEQVTIGKLKVSDEAVVRLQTKLPNLQFDARPNARRLAVTTGFDFRGGFATDATLRWLEGATNLRTLSLVGTRVTDEGMQHVAKLSKLRSLDVRYTAVGDKGLASLVNLPLDSLLIGGMKNESVGPKFEHYLGSESFTDEGLRLVAQMKSLRSRLAIASPHITDEGLLALGQLPEIENLWLTAPNVKGDGFKFVESMNHLRSLELRQVAFTHEVASHLARAPALNELDIYESRIPKGALNALAASKTLETLHLWSPTTFDEDPIPEIAAIPTLRSIALYTSACKMDDGKRLLTSRPDCKVYVLHEGQYVEVK